MIEVKNVTKKYGKAVAVEDISFTINDGEIVGLLGPNGAGKTKPTISPSLMVKLISSTATA